ncbi:hypothetical protein [Rufibacter radiotolerans]|nr:hypothetical protein [Rufibacter radiotolerans]
MEWADLIFVMEKKHKQLLISRYGTQARSKEIHILDIPDEFAYMDQELIDMLKVTIKPILLASM